MRSVDSQDSVKVTEPKAPANQILKNVKIITQNKYLERVVNKFYEIFSIDLRALAFFRISMGLIIIAYLIPRLMNVYAFYSDWGIIPRGDFFELTNNYFLSFHFISGQTSVQILLILIQMLIAFLLVIGFRSRLMTFLSWFFLISLQNRDPYVLNYGDQLFRMLLFWAIFLPLGAVWSLDSIWSKYKYNSKTWFSVGTVAMLLQVVIFYVVNWFLKDSFEWKGLFAQTHNLLDLFKFWDGFSATYYAMNFAYLVTPLGRFLLKSPELLKAATIGYIFFELLGPLALISPFKTKELRYFALGIFFTVVHGMLFLMLYTGLFQFFCLAGLILFIPSGGWNWLEKKLFKGREDLKIYYDKDCELCTTGVCAIKGATGGAQMIPIQSNTELFALGSEISTIIVEDKNGNKYQKVDAFIKMFKNSLFTSWIGVILRLKPVYWVSQKIYEFIAKNRKFISRFIIFIKPEYPGYNEVLAVLTQGFALLCLVLVLFWNYGNVTKYDYFTDPSLVAFSYSLRLDQYWGMFADKPSQVSIWLVVPGALQDGTKVDVMNKTIGDVSFDRQDEPPFRFWSQGWRNYFIDYPSHNNAHTKLFARFLCNDWNRYNYDQGKQLKSLTIITMEQRTLLQGRATPLERFRQEYTCS